MRAFTAIGLHEFMRVTLERALATLWAEEGVKFRLLPNSATKTLRLLGWSDANAYNLSTIMAHALVRTPRCARGLPYIPLCKSEPGITDLPWKIGTDKRTSLSELVAVAVMLFEVDHRTPGPGVLQPNSIREQMQDRIGLSPNMLARPLYDNEGAALLAVACDAEGQAINGLAALLMSVFRTYQTIMEEGEDIDNTAIRLLINEETRHTGDGGPRYSNMKSLLLAGLLSEAGRDLAFIAEV